MNKITCKDIYIKYHDTLDYQQPRLEMTEFGDWCDLYVAEDIELYQGDYALISMGISMKLPEGYEAIIAPRSSTFSKYGIIQTNGIGIIDNSYSGNNDIWKMPVYATRYVKIPRGVRICQFRIQPRQPVLVFISTDSLGDEDRGGFGERTGI